MKDWSTEISEERPGIRFAIWHPTHGVIEMICPFSLFGTNEEVAEQAGDLVSQGLAHYLHEKDTK